MAYGRYRRRYKRRRTFGRKRRSYRRYGKRTGFRKRMRRGFGRRRGFLKVAQRRNWWKPRFINSVPDRIYAKIGSAFLFDYDFKNVASGSGFDLQFFPMDPSRMWDISSGSGGMTIQPHQLYCCFGYQDKYMPIVVTNPTFVGAQGYKAFRCLKYKLKMTLVNMTGTGHPSLANSDSESAITGTHGEIAFGLRPSGADTQSWDYPTDAEWPSDRAFRHKTVNKPLIDQVTSWNTNGTINTAVYAQPRNYPRKTIKMTGRPWVAMQVPKKTYLTDDAFEVVLAGTAGNPSTNGQSAFVDCVAFPAWQLQTVNTRMSCRVILTAQVSGFFYRPNKMQSSIY